eukprot:GFUD01101820.1.p1 GENE.GFUD01101820.1~~GFUD01101820.1.p1  ORF type:complete len:191 (+),score=57.23 GFUD01101820.1:56-628(+)
MAGTPCGRLICDYPGPRPKYQGELLDIPNILVFKVPKGFGSRGSQNRFQVVPSYLTKDPKLVGKTRHQQAIDIMDESQSKFDRKHGEGTFQKSIATDMKEFINAGSVQGGEPKTQSCTVNNSESNLNAGQEGRMEEKQREEFMEVWAEMVKTGQDKMLRETIENKQPQSLTVYVKDQTWGITVFGLHDYC